MEVVLMFVGFSGRKKILLIDGSEIHLDVTEGILKDEYDIYRAKSGLEAIDHLCINKFKPNLILLNTTLPKNESWHILNRVRAISFLKDVPIAFLSFTEEESEKRYADEIGVAYFMAKPQNEANLRVGIKSLIETKGINTIKDIFEQ
jgi:PleD family two-component response regulator